MDHVIILAAGRGSRMMSDVPKVLTSVAGVPLIKRLLASVAAVCPRPTLVVGHQADVVKAALGAGYHYVVQTEPLGTGDAVRCARLELANQSFDSIVVLPGDHPLLGSTTLGQLVAEHHRTAATLTLVTLKVSDYSGFGSVFNHYGRINRSSSGEVVGIIEFKDATPEQRANTEVNVGYYCFNPQWLWENITELGKSNAAHEYYLTDLVGRAVEQGKRVVAYTITNPVEAMGINSPENLATVEATLIH